jgi:hypothetical protein
MRVVNFEDPVDKARYQNMVFLVHRLLWFENLLAVAKNDGDKRSLQKKIEEMENQINELVYALFHLSIKV